MGPNRKWGIYLMIVISFGLLGYSFQRAHTLSMTHDESHTYMTFKDISVWKCFREAKCWDTANNHLLNTWLMQQSTRLLGTSDLTIRLGSVFGHSLYLLFSVFLILSVSKNPFVQLIGFSLLNFNPYLLDFFSLVRGYGLSVSMELISIYFFYYWIRTANNRHLISVYLFAGLAVMANFTALNFMICLFGVHLLLIGMQWIEERQAIGKEIVVSLTIPTLFFTIIGYLLIYPIRILQSNQEFQYGAETIWDTLTLILKDSLYGNNYIGKHTLSIFMVPFILLLLIASVRGMGDYFSKKTLKNKLYLTAAILMVCTFLFMVIQEYLLGSKYLFNRKALIFFPLIAIVIYHFIAKYYGNSWARYLGLAILIFNGFHLLRSANLEYCREWWYDANTKNMMKQMEEIAEHSRDSLTLGTNWLYMPSSEYYRRQLGLQNIKPLVYSKEIYTDGRYDYYYVDRGEVDILKDNYDQIADFSGYRFLLRRKEYPKVE